MKIKKIFKTSTTSIFDFAKTKSEKIKENIDLKIQEKALLNLKAELAMRHKTFEEYSDEEIEIMLYNEKSKIVDDLKTKSLIAALALLGLDFLV